MIIAVTGLSFDQAGNMGSAGAGKDTVANRLVDRHGFVRIGLADVMKRLCAELFGWDYETLWGSSELRELLDPHHVMENGEALTSRIALNGLTEWQRRCCPDVLIEYGMKTANRLFEGHPAIARARYEPDKGIVQLSDSDARFLQPVRGVVFSDGRYRNEVEAFRRLGAKVVRIRRPVQELFVRTGHGSETGLNGVPDEWFDHVIHGPEKGVPEVQALTDRMIEELGGKP